MSALFNLAIIRTKVGATQEAIDLYRRVVEADPTNANAWFNQALLYRSAGLGAKATQGFNRAIQLDPSLADRITQPTIAPSVGPTASPSG